MAAEGADHPDRTWRCDRRRFHCCNGFPGTRTETIHDGGDAEVFQPDNDHGQDTIRQWEGREECRAEAPFRQHGGQIQGIGSCGGGLSEIQYERDTEVRKVSGGCHIERTSGGKTGADEY